MCMMAASPAYLYFWRMYLYPSVFLSLAVCLSVCLPVYVCGYVCILQFCDA